MQHLYCIEKRKKPFNPEIHTFLRKRKKNCCTCLFCPLLLKTMLPSHLADEIHTPSRGCDDMCSLSIHRPHCHLNPHGTNHLLFPAHTMLLCISVPLPLLFFPPQFQNIFYSLECLKNLVYF